MQTHKYLCTAQEEKQNKRKTDPFSFETQKEAKSLLLFTRSDETWLVEVTFDILFHITCCQGDIECINIPLLTALKQKVFPQCCSLKAAAACTPVKWEANS